LFQNLKRIQQNPATPAEIATLLKPLDTHYQTKSNRGVPPLSEVRFAALNLENSRARIEATLTPFVSELKNLTGTDRARSRSAMEQAKGGDAALVDVMTMCEGLINLPDPMVQAASDLRSAADQLVIGQTDGTPGLEGNGALKGLSLFRRPSAQVTDSNFIESVVYDDYRDLPVCNLTGWYEIAYETLLD
jgi:hypothetical protein